MKKVNLKKRKPTKSLKDTLNDLRTISGNLMREKYLTDGRYFSIKTVNEIIYNEKAHVVANFKDFLIFDDTSEFLKRYYNVSEIASRLPKIFDFYEQYSKIFANYIILPESKYMYKNIQRKQKIIDNLQKFNNELNRDQHDDTNQIFNTEIYNSLMNLTCTINEGKSIILNKENSLISIEGLINSIGKAEKTNDIKPEDVKVLQQVLTVQSMRDEKRKKENFNKVNPAIRPTTSLYNNIKSFNKKSIVTSVPRKPKAIPDYTIKNNMSKPVHATNLNILTSISNATMNTLAVKPTSKDRINAKLTTSRGKFNNTTSQKQTFISHKGANSMPKLTNDNIYNNFNIINNVSSVVTPSTQINIYNHINDGVISSQINIVESQTAKDKDTITTDISPKIKKIITISNITKKKPITGVGVTKVSSPFNSNDLKKKTLKNDSKNLKSTFLGNNTITARDIGALHTSSIMDKKKKVNTSKFGVGEKTLREIIHRDLFDNETERSNTKSKVNKYFIQLATSRGTSSVAKNLISRNSSDKFYLDNTRDKHIATNTSQNKSKLAVTSLEKKGITSPKIMSTTNLEYRSKAKMTSKSPENKINDFKKTHIDGTMTKTIDINMNNVNKKKENPNVPSGIKIPGLKIKGFYEIAKLTAIHTGSNSARIMYKSDSKNKKIKK
jgi:hypothetical protein